MPGRNYVRTFLPCKKIRGKYHNPYEKNLKKSFFDFILWKTGYYNDHDIRQKAPRNFTYPVDSKEINIDKPWVVWSGHSTFFIQINSTYIVTDPVWSKRPSPVPLIGPKRRHSPPLTIDELPHVDLVLISHNHYDHLDAKSVKKLASRFPNCRFIVPRGLKRWFYKRKIFLVEELNWWEESSIILGDNKFPTKITSVPTQHFSGRSLFDANKTLWSGFVLEAQNEKREKKRIYFAGDTGYNQNDFRQIGKKWDKIDLSLIPIGTYAPNTFMKPVHINPKEAMQIHKEVHSEFSIGMHWKTFRLSDEGMEQPPFDLFQEVIQAKINPKQFIALDPGEYVNW